MTALRNRKSKLSFATDREIRGRAIVVEPSPWVCAVRLKGTRQRYEISWDTIFVHAAQLAANKLRAERLEARKRKRGM